jgi:hypothetical protein
MAQGGGKPSFFVSRGLEAKKKDFTMLERGKERVIFVTQSKEMPLKCCVTESGQHNS